MAHSNKTKNLQLSQFSETDKPSWLSDYNSDMSKIDDAFTSVAPVVPEDSALGIPAALFDRMYIGNDNVVRIKPNA